MTLPLPGTGRADVAVPAPAAGASDRSGAFVAVGEAPLPDGSHELRTEQVSGVLG